MRKTTILASLLLILTGQAYAQKTKDPKTKDPKTTKTTTTTTNTNADKFSQALGILLAQNLQGSGLKLSDIKLSDMYKSFEETFNGKPPMDATAAQTEVMNKLKPLMEAKEKEAKALADQKSKEGEKAGKQFLLDNTRKPNIKTTASGLQYEVIKEGTGARPTLADKVKVHYHGTLIDGKVFDSSVDRGQPISFPLNGVIKGWQEGVALMTVGSKYKLYIPHELAYGAQDKGSIPPYSTLIFEVELLGINAD